MWRSMALVAGAIGVLGCAALRDDLQRAEDSYDQARYDEAQVWLVGLDGDDTDMERGQRVRYHYLRGMTAHRLGHADEALYFLALAREMSVDDEALLRAEWRQALDRTLAELTPADATYQARSAEASPRR